MERVIHGDCLEVMATFADRSFDAVVTDPPYDLTSGKKGGSGEPSLNVNSPAGRSRISTGGGFMGKEWDSTGVAFDVATWTLAYRVLKPGAHLVAFGGTRTFHRLTCAIEDAGFEIRDCLMFMYGTGFPKSLDVSKAIDKAAGAEGSRGAMKRGGERLLRETVDGARDGEGTWGDEVGRSAYVYEPATDAAREWQGWGTALKPAWEPIILARKPLTGTVAENVQRYGTGALNVDGCRIATDDVLSAPQSDPHKRGAGAGEYGISTRDTERMHAAQRESIERTMTLGRWPANVVLDAEEAGAMLDAQSGTTHSRVGTPRGAESGDGWGMTATGAEYADTGGASRFFYCAKADSSERPRVDGIAHPTVKPVDLMRWLVRLVTPPGGHVLDPFAGSGTTGEACIVEGFDCTMIEREAQYVDLIDKRLSKDIQRVML
jgi:site-specific DNA-methyltransferase (adenine-specific)